MQTLLVENLSYKRLSDTFCRHIAGRFDRWVGAGLDSRGVFAGACRFRTRQIRIRLTLRTQPICPTVMSCCS